MFGGLGKEVHYVYEPPGAAFSYAARISEPATIRVADFGAAPAIFRWYAWKRPARRGAAPRSAMPGSTSQATASTPASSTGW